MKKFKSIAGDVLGGIAVLGMLCLIAWLVGQSSVRDWNQSKATRRVAAYQRAVMKSDAIDMMREEAQAYNQALLTRDDRWTMTGVRQTEYEGKLNPCETGMQAYLALPGVKTRLPIYQDHGQTGNTGIGARHWFGSSLPIGGESTCCVLSVQTKLADLNKLQEGDVFSVYVLDEKHDYVVQVICSMDDDVRFEAIAGLDIMALVSNDIQVIGHRLTEASEGAQTGSGGFMGTDAWTWVNAWPWACIGAGIGLFTALYNYGWPSGGKLVDRHEK